MTNKVSNKFINVEDFDNGKAFVQTFDKKCYCINKEGEIMFECPPFSETYGNTTHYKFDKWNQVIIDTDIEGYASSSVLDSKGNTIIPFEKNITIDRWMNGYKFIHRIPNSHTDFAIYADNKGLQIDSTPFIYDRYISNGLLSLTTETKKAGLYSLDNQDFIIKPQYDSLYELENIINVANNDNLLCVSNNGYYGIIDYNNNLIIPIEYDKTIYKMRDYLLVSKNGKEGLITLDNEIAYDMKYDNILYCYDNCVWCCEGNIWKIVYADGSEEILPYDDCQFPCENSYLIITSFEHTKYICIKQNDKWGVVNYKKEVILPIIFDEIFEYKECNLIQVEFNEKVGLYDFNGREIVPCKYMHGFIYDSEDNKYITANDYEDEIAEYYDIKGNLLFKHKYDSLSHNVSDDVIAVYNGEYYKFITLDNKDLF